MKSFIRLISQILTLLFIGYLLALFRQKNKVIYFSILTIVSLFLALFIGAFLSTVIGGNNVIGFTRELELHWYWYFISFLSSFISLEKIVFVIQRNIYSVSVKRSFTLFQLLLGVCMSLLLLFLFISIGEKFAVPICFLIIGLLAFYLFRGKEKDDDVSEEISDLIFKKVGDMASNTIKERESIMKNRVYGDPSFKSLAKKYNMSEEEFISKVEEYLKHNPNGYTKLLNYDVRNTRWSRFF